MTDQTPEELLTVHVSGDHCPCESLLNTGAFPDGWVDRYLDLLSSLAKKYADRDMLPRQTVWDVHFASWYLPIRYNVWCSSTGNTNDETVGQLGRLRTPTELFLAEGLER